MDANFVDVSTSSVFPKTLIIKNTEDGLWIWQVYHVNNAEEASILSGNAAGNGFLYRELRDYDGEAVETWPDWRDTAGGKEIEAKALKMLENSDGGQSV